VSAGRVNSVDLRSSSSNIAASRVRIFRDVYVMTVFGRWGPSSALPKQGTEPLPNFRPKSIVAKLLDGSRWHFA